MKYNVGSSWIFPFFLSARYSEQHTFYSKGAEGSSSLHVTNSNKLNWPLIFISSKPSICNSLFFHKGVSQLEAQVLLGYKTTKKLKPVIVNIEPFKPMSPNSSCSVIETCLFQFWWAVTILPHFISGRSLLICLNFLQMILYDATPS